MKWILLLTSLIVLTSVTCDSSRFDGRQSGDFTTRHVHVVPCVESGCKSSINVRGAKSLKIDGKKFSENKLSYSELTVTAYWSNEMVFECTALPDGAIGKLILKLTGQLQNVKLIGCNVSSFWLDGEQQNVGSVVVRSSSIETLNIAVANFNSMEGFVLQDNTMATVNLVFNILSSVSWDGNSFETAKFESNQINSDVSFSNNEFDKLEWNSQNLPRLTFSGNQYTSVNFVAQNGNKELRFTNNIGLTQVFFFNVVSNNLVVDNNTWCSLVFTCLSASNGVFQMTNNIANDVNFELMASTPVVFVNNTFRSGEYRLPLVNSGLTLVNNSFSSANFTSRIFNQKLHMSGNSYRESFNFVLTEVSNGQVSIKNNAGRATTLHFRQFTGPIEVSNNFFCNFTLTVTNGNIPQLTVTGNQANSLDTIFSGNTAQTINRKDVRNNQIGETGSCEMLSVNDAYCPPVNQPRFEVPFSDVFA